jgi:hypothetical protein
MGDICLNLSQPVQAEASRVAAHVYLLVVESQLQVVIDLLVGYGTK